MSWRIPFGLMAGRGGAFGPGGVGNSLGLWFKADAITGLADAAVVAQWDDSSGNARHIVQATGTKQPTYRTGILNGLPVVRFDGGDGLRLASYNMTATNGVTGFAVASAADTGVGQMIIDIGDGTASAGNWNIYRRPTAGRDVQINCFGNVGASSFETTANLITTHKLVSVVSDFALATNESTAWVNGATAGARATNSNNTGNFATWPVNVGSRGDATSLLLTGDIAELVFYDRALTTTERETVEESLRVKYALY